MAKRSLLILFLIGLNLLISGCFDEGFTAEQIAQKKRSKGI